MEAIDGRTAHRLFMTICQFPAMRASWLREIVVGSSGEVSRHLKRFVDTGLVAVFDGRHYLSELGMRRAANMSRVLPAVIRSRHGAYLDRWYREHEQHHHDGVNRLVVRFAREEVEVVAVFVTNLNLTTYCYEPTAIACSWPNTKDQTSHLPIRRCNTSIEPIIYGGGQQNGLRSGTLPLPLCVGMAAAVDILQTTEGTKEHSRISEQRDLFIRLFHNSGIPVALNGPAGQWRHPGNANLRFRGFAAEDILGSVQP